MGDSLRSLPARRGGAPATWLTRNALPVFCAAKTSVRPLPSFWRGSRSFAVLLNAKMPVSGGRQASETEGSVDSPSPVFAPRPELIVPALSVSSLILGFNLLADGLREMSLRD